MTLKNPMLMLIAAAACCLPSALIAQSPAPGAPRGKAADVEPLPALRERADQIVRMINGQLDPAQVLSPEFLAEHPAEEVRRLATRVRGRMGDAIAISDLKAATPERANGVLDFANVRMPVEISVQKQAPHLVNGLMLGD